MADTVQITMPQMGESVSEGTVLTWHKQEGDWVEKDETIVEVSTDKVDAEVPAPAAGKLVKILAEEDETVEVGQALASSSRRGAGGRRRRARRRSPPRSPPPGQRRRAGRRPPLAAGARRRRRPRPSDTPSTPVARRVAAAHGIDLDQVSGTGTGGRVVKEDVLAYIERNGGDGAAAARTGAPEPPAQVGRPRSRCAAATRCSRATCPTASRSRPRRASARLAVDDARPAPAPAERGAEGRAARHEGLVHAPDRLRDRGRGARPPGDGPHLPRARRQAAPHRATST